MKTTKSYRDVTLRVLVFVFAVLSTDASCQGAEVAWPELQHWTESLDAGLGAIPGGGFDGGRVKRQARLLTGVADIREARRRLKLSEGRLDKEVQDAPVRRYVGGGDETCSRISTGAYGTVLDMIRRRVGVKRQQINEENALNAADELRKKSDREMFWFCESVILDDSDHEAPVYLQAFRLNPLALVLVETSWW